MRQSKSMAATRTLVFLLLLQGLAISTTRAHPGGLDGNGCHYDTSSGRYHCHRAVKPNPAVNAPVKKSRENVCHDRNSPNYSTLKFFISYPTMPACPTSGGRGPK
jgi:hypothetical protein